MVADDDFDFGHFFKRFFRGFHLQKVLKYLNLLIKSSSLKKTFQNFRLHMLHPFDLFHQDSASLATSFIAILFIAGRIQQEKH